jgi:hypothetical protein
MEINFEKEIGDYLSLLQKNIRGNLAASGSNASGEASRTLAVYVDEVSGLLDGVSYFENIEKGTAPKALGGGVSFYDILDWIDYKGIISKGDKAAKAVAGIITHKINMEGTRTYRSGGRTDIYTNEIENDSLMNDFTEDVTDKALDILFDFKL